VAGSAALTAAREAVAKINVDDLTIEDCRAADLCFQCKHPFHGRTCSAALRGKKLN